MGSRSRPALVLWETYRPLAVQALAFVRAYRGGTEGAAWWRWRESNPRPKRCAQSIYGCRVRLSFVGALSGPGAKRRLAALGIPPPFAAATAVE